MMTEPVMPSSATSAAIELPVRESPLRWGMLALLFLVTVINFVDRQALSIVSPVLREQFHLTATDYGRIVAGFTFGMLIGEFPMGWLSDRFGVRRVLPIAVLWWSTGNALHAFARSTWQFAALRFWLGTGECANYSGGMKVVAQWFQPKDRAFATGIFNGGATIGSIIAPPLLVWITSSLGWQMAFVLPSSLGLVWALAWRAFYRDPIAPIDDEGTPPTNASLLRRPEVWGLMLMRALAGPVSQFYIFWLPDYLNRERGLTLTSIGMFAWIPFLFADLGSIGGGWFSGFLIRQGWTITAARRIAMWLGAALCVTGFIVTSAHSAAGAIALICVVLFGHYALSANMFTRISDLLPGPAVSRVTGLTGIAQGVSGFAFPLLTGWLIDHGGYTPVFALTALMPAAGVFALFALSRKGRLEE